MDTLQCAVVLAKLERFEWELAQRRALGLSYVQLLRDAGARLDLPAVRPDRDCVWAQFTVQLDERDSVQRALHAVGIPTAVHYPKPLHHQPAFAGTEDPAGCPRSVAASRRVLSLPVSADLTEADQQRVVAALAQALAAVRSTT
jgi:UDP-2-acetamido-2-deoxy-ribo-hexuluronate aminotransferase